MNAQKIKLSDLVTEGLQIRCAIDKDVVAEYAEAMKDGAKFPPIIVYREERKPRKGKKAPDLYLADGYHRVGAAKELGLDEIEADVREGGFNEALKYALHANAEHGLRRTNADKWHALEVTWKNRKSLFKSFLGQDKDKKPNGEPSSTQLAEMTAVTQRFAAKFIKTASEDSSKSDSDEETAAESEGVKANLTKGLDRFGVAIPENLLPAFKGAADVRKLSREVRALRNSLEERFKSNDLAFAAIPQQALINLDNAMHEIKSGQAYCVCRGCSGTGCYRCSDHGFQTGAQYRKMPEEYKAKEA